MKYITKQAYINGLAARGVLRNRIMQKIAEENGEATETKTESAIKSLGKETYGLANQGSSNQAEESAESTEKEDGTQGKRSWPKWYLQKKVFQPGSGYLTPGLVGAGVTGVIGALIQAARKKNILLGAGIGAGVGGLTGLGSKYINDKYIYPKIYEKYGPKLTSNPDEEVDSADAIHESTDYGTVPTPPYSN